MYVYVIGIETLLARWQTNPFVLLLKLGLELGFQFRGFGNGLLGLRIRLLFHLVQLLLRR